jgi:hypothetical protein
VAGAGELMRPRLTPSDQTYLKALNMKREYDLRHYLAMAVIPGFLTKGISK